MSELFKKIMIYLGNKRLKNLLLNGHSSSNSFTIIPENAKLFIDSQETPRKKLAAKLLIETNRYIPHSEFINKFETLVDKFFERINKSPVKDYIILSEQESKSGFFCTMIFLFIVQTKIQQGKTKRYRFPVNIITGSGSPQDFAKKVVNIIITTKYNIVDINDADYSANQQLGRVLQFFFKIRSDLKSSENIHTITDPAVNMLKRTLVKGKWQRSENPLNGLNFLLNHKFQPTMSERMLRFFKSINPFNPTVEENNEIQQIGHSLAYRDSIANQLAERFYTLRVFSNSVAIRKTKDGWGRLGAHNYSRRNYLYAEKIPTLKETINKNYKDGVYTENKYHDLISFFGGCSDSAASVMNIYLDHKVADWASTVALSISMGLVPGKCSYWEDIQGSCWDGFNPKPAAAGVDGNRIEGSREECKNGFTGNTIIPLINNCNYDIIEEIFKNIPINTAKLMVEKKKRKNLRCPNAWYKLIDYNNGTVDLTNTRIINPEDDEKYMRQFIKKGGKKRKNKKKTKKKRKRRRKRRTKKRKYN